LLCILMSWRARGPCGQTTERQVPLFAWVQRAQSAEAEGVLGVRGSPGAGWACGQQDSPGVRAVGCVFFFRERKRKGFFGIASLSPPTEWKKPTGAERPCGIPKPKLGRALLSQAVQRLRRGRSRSCCACVRRAGASPGALPSPGAQPDRLAGLLRIAQRLPTGSGGR